MVSLSKLRYVAASLMVAGAVAWPNMARMSSGARATFETLQSGSRADKLKAAVQQNQQTAYGLDNLPVWDKRDISSAGNFLKFGFYDMDISFDNQEDTMPDGRRKFIHPLGSTGPVKFVASADSAAAGFTGMFKGGDSCLARLSLAANPEKVPFTPGMALKCFRDGQTPSGNFITMYSLDGQPDNTNFFANAFSNIVANPESSALKLVKNLIFAKASHCPTWISTKQFADIDQSGSLEANSKWPIQMWLVPADVKFPTNSSKDFRVNLASIPVGSTLWKVYGVEEYDSTDRIYLGDIVSTGPFIASQFSDEVLFFEHERGESDGC